MQENVQEELAAMGGDKKHLIALEQGGSCASVVLRVDCTADDVLDAYVHAFMLLHAKLPLVGSLQLLDAVLEVLSLHVLSVRIAKCSMIWLRGHFPC